MIEKIEEMNRLDCMTEFIIKWTDVPFGNWHQQIKEEIGIVNEEKEISTIEDEKGIQYQINSFALYKKFQRVE